MTVDQYEKAHSLMSAIMKRKWEVEDLGNLIENVKKTNEPCKLGGLAGGLEVPKGIVLGLLRREKIRLESELKQLHTELADI